MLTIKTNGKTLDTDRDLTLQITDYSPIFNDMGSQTMPATIPATYANLAALGYPDRMDTAANPRCAALKADVACGTYIRRGSLNVISSGRDEGITFNIGFDNSEAYMEWKNRRLCDLAGLPRWEPGKDAPGFPIDRCLDHLYHLYRFANAKTDDFAVFPIAVKRDEIKVDDNTHIYWELLNVPGASGMAQPEMVERVIDGNVNHIRVPEAYGITPFLRVWRVIELAFSDLGLRVVRNPFKSIDDLARVVVLNNAADSVCRGYIDYADLMPDCTVGEFFKSLWARFGLVYSIYADRGEVDLALMRDIVRTDSAGPLPGQPTAHPFIEYLEPQYLKLGAKTSLTDAKPADDRFEDFARGIDLSTIHLGSNIAEWTNTGTEDAPVWDGDVMEEIPDDPEPGPDPDVPDYEDDDRARSAPSRSAPSQENERNPETFLAREFVTGTWYRLDAINSEVYKSSSGFFDWDPASENIDDLAIESDDECVPIVKVTSHNGNTIDDFCPAYLTGSRHYHSYIKECSGENNNDVSSTPLAFMMAYTTGRKTIGRITPENPDGTTITPDDGSVASGSLLFQFADGLFAKYWKEYDEILRHGNREIELHMALPKSSLQTINMLRPYTVNGVRCLVSSVEYTFPSGKTVIAVIRLRSIQTMGVYNIAAEQRIPTFSSGSRHLQWSVVEDGMGPNLDTYDVREAAANAYISESGYAPHDGWYVSSRTTILKSIDRLPPVWEKDPRLPNPWPAGLHHMHEYMCRLTYDIYEIRNLGHPGAEDDIEMSETPVGTAYVDVPYMVTLKATWTND